MIKFENKIANKYYIFCVVFTQLLKVISSSHNWRYILVISGHCGRLRQEVCKSEPSKVDNLDPMSE